MSLFVSARRLASSGSPPLQYCPETYVSLRGGSNISNRANPSLTEANLKSLQQVTSVLYEGNLAINSRYNCNHSCNKSGMPTRRLSLLSFIIHLLEEHFSDSEQLTYVISCLGLHPPFVHHSAGLSMGFP
jgi:hypothetical protein